MMISRRPFWCVSAIVDVKLYKKIEKKKKVKCWDKRVNVLSSSGCNIANLVQSDRQVLKQIRKKVE